MDILLANLALFIVIVTVGILFRNSTIPTSLLLVVTGMLLSLLPFVPSIELQPKIVLNLFLPVLIYQISSFASWKDVKKNFRPIILLSIGHVIFITLIVAITFHYFVPEMGWPLAFVLGAVVSPPDDVAIVSIAEKIRMPTRIVTILEGEGMFNDATALILFRFALAALVTHQFSAIDAISMFFIIVIGETLYGLAIGYLMGELRLKITDPILQMMLSFLTPFLTFLPAEYLGGSGVLATVVAGFVIGHRYSVRFTPEIRLISRAIWPTIAFILQSVLFLLVGLDMRLIYENIAQMPAQSLILYSVTISLVVIIGRFLWVYPSTYLPRLFFPYINKKDPSPPWQYPVVISWAGMRGAISLAAVLAIPALPSMTGLPNPKYLLVFLTFSVITATLVIQGLSLPFLLNILGIHKYGDAENYKEHLNELAARVAMTKAAIRWLREYRISLEKNPILLEEIKLRLRNYKALKAQLEKRINAHTEFEAHDEKAEVSEEIFITSKLIEVENKTLMQLWSMEKISHKVRNKLLAQLDHRAKNLSR